MFSEIFGLVGAGLGAYSSIQASQAQERIAEKEQAMKWQALQEQKRQADMAFSISQQERDREYQQEQYLRQSNERNRVFLSEEYESRLQGQKDRLGQGQRERAYVLDRQQGDDRAAQQQRDWRMSQLLMNQGMAREERKLGVDELRRAQGIAASERSFELGDYEEQKDQAQQERSFSIDELRRSQRLAASERMQEEAIRDRILRSTDAFSASLEKAFAGLGPVTPPQDISQAEIDGEIRSRTQEYLADVDRAGVIASSQSEAELMRRGIDGSSTGDGRRGDIARRIVDEYGKARNRGRTEAMAYISGKQGVFRQDFQNELDARERTLSETAKAQLAPIEVMMRMPKMGSANDYRTPVNIGSGVVNRKVTSANDYRNPVGITSEIYDRLDPGSGRAGMLNAPSVAEYFALNAGSRLQQQQMWANPNPLGYFAQGANLLQSYTNGFNPEPYYARAQAASASAGKALGSMASSAGRLFDGGFGGMSGGGTPAGASASGRGGGAGLSWSNDYAGAPAGESILASFGSSQMGGSLPSFAQLGTSGTWWS